MRKLRKSTLLLAGSVNVVVAVLCLGAFVHLTYYINDTHIYVVNILLLILNNISSSMYFDAESCLRLIMYYVAISGVIHFGVGLLYFHFSRFKYEKFFCCRNSFKAIVVLNAVVNIAFINLVLATISLHMSVNTKESKALQQLYQAKHQQLIYNNIITKNSNLMMMSMEIEKLKQDYNNSNISKGDYEKKLLEIFS